VSKGDHRTRLVTLDEFEQLPDIDGIQELLDGVAVETPPPKVRHSELVKRTAQILQRRLSESRVWTGTGFVIGPHCVQPDAVVIHPDQGEDRGWYAGAPLVAIEVASRGNAPKELERKKDLYLANGAQEVWIVYDKTRSVVVHAGSDAVRCLGRFLSHALGVEISASDIFD
jgi:Uma2 family endonuclease